MRLVVDAVKGKNLASVLSVLEQLPKEAARPLSRVLASALANAKQKNVATESLRIKAIEVMGGPATKRFRAVSRGMAHGYKKRTSHVRVVLTDS